ncbi:MAG: sulfatase-like hydrolase/transferase [Lentisphaerales bacterium]|nr:sulfatase-like hydrolase/transferase [Lentisphaerales bacterium]
MKSACQKLLSCLILLCAFTLKAEKPNIVFILMDDLGKEWISSYGAQDIDTPHIDALAQNGMKFTNFYSMPQCTPTRVAFMTGQYPFRNGWVNHWDVPRWGGGCHFDWEKNPSIARVMQSAGYKTAVAGKWQVNDFRIQPKAMVHHGFDDYCMWTGYETGNPASGKRYWDPYLHTKKGSKTYGDKYSEDIFSDFLINFMKENKDDPMFLYYAMCLPHGPLEATPDAPNATEKVDVFKAMVKYADKIIGKIDTALTDLGIRENTILIVTADNGSTGSMRGTMNGRIVHGGKTRTTENGINGPFIVSAPGLVPQGKTNNTLCDVTDLLPTFAKLGGAQLPEDHIFDGLSFADVLLGKTEKGPRSWNMSMGGKGTVMSDKGVENVWYFRDRVISNGKYKLWVSPARKPVKLVDTTKDFYEKENLIQNPEYAEVVNTLFAVVKNQLEKDNDPNYTPLKPQKWDLKPTVKSQEWKSGKPGDIIEYIPDVQGSKKNKK